MSDRDCKILIVMGKTDPDNPNKHLQQSMVLVPRETPGVRIVRDMRVFGYDDAPRRPSPRSSTTTCACRPKTCCSARAAASRSRRGGLGPGRIHHCMRLIGCAQRALELMCARAQSRVAFGKPLGEQGIGARGHRAFAGARSSRRG